MNLTFTLSAWDDYQWFVQHDRKLLKDINQLSLIIQREIGLAILTLFGILGIINSENELPAQGRT